MKSPITLSVVLTLLTISAGCHDTFSVKPTELPKLNGSKTTSVSYSGFGVLGYQTLSGFKMTQRTVELADGSLGEIKGTFDASIYTERGRVEFKHPVRSTLTDDTLEVRSASRGPFSVRVDEVRRAEVYPLSVAKTTALGFAIVVPLTTLLCMSLL